MDFKKYFKNGALNLKVAPRSGREELVERENGLKLFLKAPAEDNKANLELIKFFKKEFKLKVEIISGMKSREKVVRITR